MHNPSLDIDILLVCGFKIPSCGKLTDIRLALQSVRARGSHSEISLLVRWMGAGFHALSFDEIWPPAMRLGTVFA
jgi:hypothetical protein